MNSPLRTTRRKVVQRAMMRDLVDQTGTHSLAHFWDQARHPLELTLLERLFTEFQKGKLAEDVISDFSNEIPDPFVLLDLKEWQEDQAFLQKRKTQVLSEYSKVNALTPEIQSAIESETTLPGVEDFAHFLRPKHRSKATLARDAGLGALADWIWGVAQGTITPEPGQSLEIWAFTFRNERKEIDTVEKVLDGASALLIERLTETPLLRKTVRTLFLAKGILRIDQGASSKNSSRYAGFLNKKEKISDLLNSNGPFRYSLYRKGWIEEELSLHFESEDSAQTLFQLALEEIKAHSIRIESGDVYEFMKKCCETAMKNHLWPALEAELHRSLREHSEHSLARNAAKSFKKILDVKPLTGAFLGVASETDSGTHYLAAIDPEGKYLAHIPFDLSTEEKKAQSSTILSEALKNPALTGIAIGDRPASRKTERALRSLFRELKIELPIYLVPEGGVEGLPLLDPVNEGTLPEKVRIAAEIARRVMNPISALKKVPELKQVLNLPILHEVNAARLERELKFSIKSAEALPPTDPVEPLSFPLDAQDFSSISRGRIYWGIVNQVTDFGAFFDLGIEENALLHSSQIKEEGVSDPREKVFPGDRMQVIVSNLNPEKKQIALSRVTEETLDILSRPAPSLPKARTLRPPPPPRSTLPRKPHKVPQPHRPHVPFHNPFAGLAALKTQLPKKKSE